MHGLAVLAWIGAGISWWGIGRYLLGVLREGTQPRLASWIAWGAANGVLAAVAFLHHSYLAAAFNGLAALGNASVLVAAAVRRAGERPSGSTDFACLGMSGACLVAICALPHATYLDALLAMGANVVATWPTLQHAWMRPQEETWQFFAANIGANSLGLVSVASSAGLALGAIAGPLISTLGNVAMLSITLGRGWLSGVASELEAEVSELEEQLGEVLAPAAETEES